MRHGAIFGDGHRGPKWKDIKFGGALPKTQGDRALNRSWVGVGDPRGFLKLKKNFKHICSLDLKWNYDPRKFQDNKIKVLEVSVMVISHQQ